MNITHRYTGLSVLEWIEKMEKNERKPANDDQREQMMCVFGWKKEKKL